MPPPTSPSASLTSTRIPSSFPRQFHPLPATRNHLHFRLPPPLSTSPSLPPPHFLPILQWRIRASASVESIGATEGSDLSADLSLDAFLSVAEFVCLLPPAICSAVCLIGMAFPGAAAKPLRAFSTSRLFAAQYFLLVGAVAIGSLIRWRRWRQFSGANATGVGADLVGRIERVEEELRCSATVVGMLSRKLEKLGVRFRVTRRALKDPITETAAVAQKNSEATQALAMQEDILEKEIGEIQRVLLSMQEQQQKQLELILAIGKAGRLFDKRDLLEQNNVRSFSSAPENRKTKELRIKAERIVGGNDKPFS